MILREERPVVEKEAVPVERVRLGTLRRSRIRDGFRTGPQGTDRHRHQDSRSNR